MEFEAGRARLVNRLAGAAVAVSAFAVATGLVTISSPSSQEAVFPLYDLVVGLCVLVGTALVLLAHRRQQRERTARELEERLS